MFVLYLNDMRGGAEYLTPVASATTPEKLIAFMEGEAVVPYTDTLYHKCFRQGGPLEWYNRPFHPDNSIMDIGTLEDYLAQASRQFNAWLNGIPTQLD